MAKCSFGGRCNEPLPKPEISKAPEKSILRTPKDPLGEVFGISGSIDEEYASNQRSVDEALEDKLRVNGNGETKCGKDYPIQTSAGQNPDDYAPSQ